MNPTVSQPISAAQYPQTLPIRSKVSAAAWDSFTVHVVDVQADFSETMTFSDLVLNLRISGTCHLRREVGSVSVARRSVPGSMNVIPAHLTARWEARAISGNARTMAMFVPEAFLARVIAENWGVESRKVEIIPQFLIHDLAIEGVLSRLALEARHDSPPANSMPRAHANSWRIT